MPRPHVSRAKNTVVLKGQIEQSLGVCHVAEVQALTSSMKRRPVGLAEGQGEPGEVGDELLEAS